MSLAVPHIPDVLLSKTSRNARAALIFGSLSLCFGILASIPAFIYGDRALREIDRDPTHPRGRDLALTGIITAALGMYIMPILLFVVVLPFVRDRIHRADDAANLHRIGKAMFAYSEDHESFFPPAFSVDANGRPPLSWRVALLPYLGEKELYEQYHLDEPWNSPHNAALIGRMPKVYAHPADPSSAAQGLTYYRVLISESLPFNNPVVGPMFPASFANGTSQTFLVVGAADPVPWTKPDELWYNSQAPVPKLGGLLRGGFNVVMADGSVRFIPNDLSERKLREAIGEEPDPTDW